MNYRSAAVADNVLVRVFVIILAALSRLPRSTLSTTKAKAIPASILQRHGPAKSAPMPLTTAYDHITLDFTRNPYFAVVSSLPSTITHGMFTGVATGWYVETVVAKGISDRARDRVFK